ncbi:PQQ-binding-like beta-propeller repeat protein [Natronorubrum sp. JWXQ-INN-674]|uniref:PQQ-binding-like beta-propeller repeat protein n=1 Tax=Natronorubrum halalkaliphilum TaxID=2691917 RepID=A0A6B0VJZ1_9EURY|nr:PQQ-binding-like beta-propeller repeat protein [Natronorubrum halalkaliphilum]MXV61296.1 PQQ-binding-like beta-propeller repeat protein [Natronorubrum halalkaliphilum]
MSSADGSAQRPQPMPTAHEVVAGCTLNRRAFLQGAAATGTAAAIGAAGTGTVAADDDPGLVDGLKEAVTGAATDPSIATVGGLGLAVFVGATAVDTIYGNITEDPSADRHILHQLVDSETDSMDSHFVNFGNYMNDTRPIASLEARHGMAQAWEEGEGSSGGYDRALQRIRQYYELPEFNHLHAGNKALLQLSYIANSGMDTDPVYPIAGSAYIDGDSSDTIQMRITNEREEVEWTLHDGTVVDENAFDNIDHIDGADGVPTTPVIEFGPFDEFDTAEHSQPITQDVLDSWSEDGHPLHGGGYVTFEADDGTEYQTDLKFVTQAVDDDVDDDDDDDDDPTQSQRAFDGAEWLRLYDRVSNLSDDVVSRYDQGFVSDIYDELEAGNITPEQVRSPEGMARFLSGTDDPANDRFRIAWMQQFGFARADMTAVSGMSVNWTGATDSWVDSDPELDDRHVYPDGYVEDVDYSGVLFGTDVSEDGFQPGGRYAVGLPVYVGAEDELIALDPSDGSRIWKYTKHSDDLNDVEVMSDGTAVFTGADDAEFHSIDPNDGSQNWTFDTEQNRAERAALSPDEDILCVGDDDGGLFGLNTDDGSQQWHVSGAGSTTRGLAYSPDGNTIYATYNDNVIQSIDANDRSENWSVEFSLGTPRDLLADDDSLFVAFTDSAVMSLDATDGSENWTFDQLIDGNNATGLDLFKDTLYVASFEEVAAVAVDDGSSNWIASFDEMYPSRLKVAPGGQSLFIGGSNGLCRASASDGSVEWEIEHDGADYPAIRQPEGEIDGLAGRSIMFDESTDDRQGEGQVDLWDGVVEVNDMWDANGHTIEHTDEQTFEDVEALEATPDSIDTIIDEMDEFDSTDDIRFIRDLELIFDHYDVPEDDRETVSVNDLDYSSPDYDSYDSSEFADAMAELEEKIEQIEDDDGDTEVEVGLGFPDLGDFEGAGMLGLGLIGVVVLAVVGIVTDLIPGLGN